jgi:hypothetical protein
MKIEVKCECHETIGSLMGKINAGAANLRVLLAESGVTVDEELADHDCHLSDEDGCDCQDIENCSYCDEEGNLL